MRKIIAFLGTHFAFFIGDIFCRISYTRVKGKFLFDKKGARFIGMFLASNYQRFMGYSSSIQKWGGLKKPWVDCSESLLKNIQP